MDAKVVHRYNVKTTATIYIGPNAIEVPVEFKLREMPWDKDKSLSNLLQEAFNGASIEFSMKTKRLSVEKEF